MFDFLFGGKTKIELIRELVEQRMRNLGIDDMDSRLRIKKMGNLELIGTPEGTLVTIVESFTKMRGQGKPIWQMINEIEEHRKSIGHDYWQYFQIVDMGKQANEEAANALPMYTRYRIQLEHPNVMSDEQFKSAFIQTVRVLTN